MNDWEAFQQWLEDHNYCKVVPCEQCHFWGHALDPKHASVKRCRAHQVDTYHDDFCSDAVMVRKGE